MHIRSAAKFAFVSIALIAFIWVAWFIIETPPLTVTATQSEAVIDAQTLGEYPTAVSRLTISSQEDGTVLDIRSPRGRIALTTFVLRSGHNDLKQIVVDSGPHKSEYSSQQSAFTLRRGVRYRIRIWRGIASSEDSFEF